jgi:F0F1-type ATP synthase membrane subunit b/b'
MLSTRILLCFLIILLIMSYCCECQEEIRKAIRAKKNRKIKEGKQKIQRGKQAARRVKNQAKVPIDRATAKVNKKYQNARRKTQAIENIINS